MPVLIGLAVTMGGCTDRVDDGNWPVVLTSPIPPRLAECDAEIRAFAAVARLARSAGDDWTVFDPAIQALREQIADCVEGMNEGIQSIERRAPARPRYGPGKSASVRPISQ